MGTPELLFLLAIVVVFLLMWLALHWRSIAIDYRAICKDHQRTILLQERELLDLRPYKRNHDHRVEKRAML